MNVVNELAGARSDTLAALYRKIEWRIMPIIFLSYTIAYLDRVNVGFAKLQMSADIGLSASAFGLGAGIFFVTYVFLEIPSNLYLAKTGARVWISRIMVSWGVVTVLTMFVRTPAHFYIARALLGVAEAGFYPGMIFYISQWFPSHRRTRAISLLGIAAPVGAIVAGPLSGWIMQNWSGVAGLAGWQWLFVLQGVPALVMSVIFFVLMPATPAAATWLSADERMIVQDAVRSEHRDGRTMLNASDALTNGRLWLTGAVLGAGYLGAYAVTFWLPTLVRAAGVAGMENLGLLAAIPFIVAALVTLPIAALADKTGRHRLIAFIGLTSGAAGVIVCVAGNNQLAPTIVGMTIACAAFSATNQIIWGIGGWQVGETAAAAGFALMNTIASVGSFFGPYLIGLGTDLTGHTDAGLVVIAAIIALAAASIGRLPARLPS
jgi:sugar phosphate permease